MPIDASLYAAFAPRQKGALDYAQEFAGLDAARQTQQANALQQQFGQAKFDEYQRGVKSATALEQLMGSMAGKPEAEVVQGLRGAGRYNEAAAMEEGMLKRQKTGAEIRKETSAAGKTEFETKEAKKKQAILDIAVLPDFDGARASISAKVASGELPMQMADGILRSMPQDPAQFAQWKNNLILKMAAPEAQLTAQTQTRGQDMTAATAAAGQQVTRETAAQADARIRAEGAANRAVQMRGQNLTDARAGQAMAEAGVSGSAPVLGVPRPAVLPWANQSRAIDANKVKAAEASRGAKEIERDEEAARADATAAALAKRFMELNARQKTGGLTDKVGIGRGAQALFSAEREEMEAITAKLVPAMRAPGSGATSDYDARMFERGTVGVDKKREANDAIAAGLVARGQLSQDYTAFRQTYLEQNGTLQGADRYWKQYVTANPIFDPKAKTPTINEARVPWRDYFGSSAPAPAATTPARVVDFSSLK